MCFDADASPPELPEERATGSEVPAELLELTSADGTRFSAALALTAAPAGPGVVILPDVRGLYPFYVQLAERFAQAGHDAIAIDYFGRTAGLGPRDDTFEYLPHVQQTQLEQVQADAAAALARLGGPAVTVGFCFGGTHAFLSAASDLPLAGAVGFYGNLSPARFPHPATVAGQMRVPVLGLFGGADPGIPPELIEAFAAALIAAGVHHDVVTYPDAPHSFFDRSFDKYAQECADAWRRILDFLASLR
jgi:carboxymethylenebutenolidase